MGRSPRVAIEPAERLGIATSAPMTRANRLAALGRSGNRWSLAWWIEGLRRLGVQPLRQGRLSPDRECGAQEWLALSHQHAHAPMATTSATSASIAWMRASIKA